MLVFASPGGRAGPQVSEGRPRWVQLGWWSTEDHREAGQRPRARPGQEVELGELQGSLRREGRSTGVGCPSRVNLVET